MAENFRNFLSGAAAGFGNTFIPYIQKNQEMQMQERQNQRQQSLLNSALTEAQQIYANPNKSPQDKQFQLAKVLSNNPELYKILSSNMQNIENNQQSQNRYNKVFGDQNLNQTQSNDIPQNSNQKQNNLQDKVNKWKNAPIDLKAQVAKDNPKLATYLDQEVKKLEPLASDRPIEADQLKKIQEVRNIPGFDDMDELQQYRAFTDAGVSRKNAEVESGIKSQQLSRNDQKIQKSYDAQKDFINDTTNSYKGFETEMKPRLLQMQSMPADKIIGPTAATFLEHLGIPLGALENPHSELYNKLSQDLLKGLPETYGSRILKVEVDNFLKTIPTLLNSPDGRRMIASNMLKLGEMKEVYYNAMRNKQKEIESSGQTYPRDFQQEVFDQVKPQIDRINNEFVKMAEVTSVPEGTIPFFSPNGIIEFVPEEHSQWAQENGGKRIW